MEGRNSSKWLRTDDKQLNKHDAIMLVITRRLKAIHNVRRNVHSTRYNSIGWENILDIYDPSFHGIACSNSVDSPLRKAIKNNIYSDTQSCCLMPWKRFIDTAPSIIWQHTGAEERKNIYRFVSNFYQAPLVFFRVKRFFPPPSPWPSEIKTPLSRERRCSLSVYSDYKWRMTIECVCVAFVSSSSSFPFPPTFG